MRNILLLVDILYGYAGGAEKQILELAKNADRNKYSVIIGCLSGDKELLTELSKKGIPTINFGVKRIYSIHGIIQGFKFIKLARNKKIDILTTYHFGSDVWGAIFGKLASISVIISNRRDMGFWKKSYHNYVYIIINRFFNKIVVVSEAVKKAIIKSEHVRQDKIAVIKNGIDMSSFSNAYNISDIKASLGISKDTFIIGCVGNIKRIKGHIYLIKALVEIKNEIQNFKCIIVGDENYKEARAIQEYIHLNCLNDLCLFMGERNDIPRLLTIMDICVLPSLSEGLSNTLLEYMAAGRPIIATSVGSNAELITSQKNGILVAPADSHALAEAIISLINNLFLRDRLGQCAREVVAKSFSMNKMVNEYEVFFENLMPNRPNNICHLISSVGLFGAEKVMLNLTRRINYNGMKSWIAVIENVHNPHLELIEAAQKENICAFSIKSHGRLDFGCVSTLCDFIKKNNINLIHTHNFKANFIGLLAAKKCGIPIIATLHGYTGVDFKLRCYERLDRFVIRYFNKVILVDESLKKWFGSRSKKYEVINNGVEVDPQSRQNGSFSYAPQEKIVIGTVGRLSQEKGHRYLIEAFATVNKEYPNSTLLIVGEGALRNELKGLSVNLGLKDKITFAGFQEDVKKFYSSMDIYVSPSLVEHFPVSILEAMSFSKPVIATNVGGTSRLVRNDETGVLIKPHSSEEIAKAIFACISNPSRASDLGNRAWQFVAENCSLQKMADSYKNVYAEVLALANHADSANTL